MSIISQLSSNYGPSLLLLLLYHFPSVAWEGLAFVGMCHAFFSKKKKIQRSTHIKTHILADLQRQASVDS